jgi:hypothetical protein
MSATTLKISLLVCLFALARHASAQDASRLITLHADQLHMKEVLNRIEAQSGLHFSYPSRLIDEDEPMSLHLDAMSLEDALQILFKEHRITFELAEQQVVLKRSRRKRMQKDVPAEQESVAREKVKFTLSGFVRDARSGEILIGATVSIPGGTVGTISNSYGFYSLTVDNSVKALLCSYVGYRRASRAIHSGRDQSLHFEMEKEFSQIQEVSIYSDELENMVRTTRSSEERINPESVRLMPALFGEKDVLKSLAAVPGIKFFGDGSTIFFVRGGGRDQNMITIDEAPLYNPTHLLGYFSTIIPDAVKDVKIYKGDFPSNYGGRLSSLIDIRTKDGNMNHFEVDGSVGLLSSRLSLEGPIWKEHISYFASGRRSYITRPIQNWNPNINDLHFSDLHLKLNYRINSNNRVFFSIYRGEDNYEAEERS